MKIAYALNHRGMNKLNFDRIKYFCNINEFIILDRKKFFQKILFSKEVLITDEFYLYFDVILILLFCYLTNKKITFYAWETYSIDTQSLISEINLNESQNEMSKQKFILYLYKFIKRKVRLGLTKIIEILIYKIFCDEKNLLITQSELRREYLKGKLSDLNITVIKNFPIKDHLVLNKIESNLSLSSSYIILAGRINDFNDLKTIAEKTKKENIQLILVGEETDQIKTIISLFPKTVKFLGYLENRIILNLYRGALGGLVIYSNGSINQNFSASCKLFDMMAVGCPVIASDNKGVIYELDGYKYPYVTIKKFNKKILENIKIQIKKSFKKNRHYIELFTYELAMRNFIDQKKRKL